MKNTGMGQFLRNQVRGISAKKKVNFFRQLGILTDAGITILKSLKMLHKSARGNIKYLIRDAILLIEQGNDFSKTGLYYPKFFDKTTIAMISAGETSGNLPEIFKQIYISLEKKDKFRNRIKSAMMIPLLTLAFAIGVVFFMAIKVIPEFSKFLSSAGGDLPEITQMVLDISTFILENWKDILIYSTATIVCILAIYMILKPVRYALDYILIYFPLIGGISLYGNLAKFSNSMEKLIGSGVSLIESIKISKETISLLPFRTVVDKASNTIVSGGNFSKNFEQTSFIPVIFSDLLQAGEESGNLDETLKQLTKIYEEETDRKISTLQASIQPVMTILIGGLVGVIAASLILGMVSMWSANS